MPRTDKYYVGPKLLADIRETISRVAGMTQGAGGNEAATRLQTLHNQPLVRRGTFNGLWQAADYMPAGSTPYQRPTSVVVTMLGTTQTVSVANYVNWAWTPDTATCLYVSVGGTPTLISGPSPLMRGTFTGSWSKGDGNAKAVTVQVAGGTATVNVTNYTEAFLNPDGVSTTPYGVVFGDAGGKLTVTAIEQDTCRFSIGGTPVNLIPGFVPGEIQLLGHSANPDTASSQCVLLEWYSVTQCGTATFGTMFGP